MLVLKGFLIVIAFVALWAFVITAIIVAVAEDEESFADLTPEELAEERYKYACYEDTEIES